MLALIINGGSGTDDDAEQVRNVEARLRSAGHEVRATVSTDPDVLRQGADDAIKARAELVIAGGGDGTICLVSGRLAGTGMPLGVLPMGTLNHFAKDLGLPLEIDKALDVILAGHTRDVDVGEVNGRVFINNSSLGLYPAIVRIREKHHVRGWRKWPVAFRATIEAMKRQPKFTIRVTVDGEDRVYRTPIFFVGNNAYRASGFGAGQRESLSEGQLALYIVEVHRRGDLVRLVWNILTGTAEDSDRLEVLLVEDAIVETRHSSADVSRDGEVERLETPLKYRVRAKALKVLAPRAEQGKPALRG